MSKKMSKEQKEAAIKWLKDHQPNKPGSKWDHPALCVSCRVMRPPDEFDSRKVLRCKHCDLGERIAKSFRGRLHSLLKGRRDRKMEAIIGVDRVGLGRHIESLFTEGMNWENRSEWHIDHIIPVCSFDHSKPHLVRECWHYSNLRPLWAHLNMKKGKRTDTGI